jgi:tetratricopeptide (TPR) repeat protein
VAKTIRAYSLYLEYGLRPEVAQRRKDLLDAIKLYTEVIDGAPADGTLDPKLYIERGDAYLQLAYVAHKARVELKETGPSIFEYLTQAQKNAEAVIDSSASSAMRVEAMNLWGNASEDMAYYAVDPNKDAWRSHYEQAIERFGQAFDEDSSSPIAPFNLARCRYRLSVDARRHAKPGEAIDSSSLEKAVNAVQAALTNWGASDSLKKAEAYYWLSEFQENLHKLDDADKARGEAVAMADRLGDPNWQVYQLQWAMLGMQRWMESTPANRDKLQTEARARVMKLLEVFGSGESAATTSQTKRVDATNAAESIGLLIQLEVDPQRAIQTVEQALNGNRFAGNDPVNRACRAQIRLALASRILALRYSGAASFDTLKPQAEAFAKEVLTLTNEAPLAEQEATNRAKAHWILGELDRAEVDPEKPKDQNVQFLTNAREHYRAGIEALPDTPELQFPELSARLNNVVGFAMTAAGQTRLSTKEQFRPIAAATEKYLLAVRPQVAALIPTQVINGKPASAWLTDIDRLSGIFKEAAKAQ